MLIIIPSRDDNTIAVEFNGQATKEDAEKLDRYVKEKFPGNLKFNVLAIMHDVDGSSFRGAVQGMKFDAKRWSQFQKFAVVTDKKWIQTVAAIGNYLPSIEAKQFDKDQIEQAWQWIKES